MAKRTVFVRHEGYGCDTGCCGHVVTVEVDDAEVGRRFDFTHPHRADVRQFVIDLVTDEFGADHVADIDWDQCLVVDD